MSIEEVLRRIGRDEANALADAWHDYERELNGQFGQLRSGVEKAAVLSTVSLSLAGLTLAGLIAVSYYIGFELGALGQRVGAVEGRLERVEARLDGVEGRLERVEGRLEGVERRLEGLDATLRGIDERTRRIEANQRAAASPGPPAPPDLGAVADEDRWRRFQEAVLGAHRAGLLDEAKRLELVASFFPGVDVGLVAMLAAGRAARADRPASAGTDSGASPPDLGRARLLQDLLSGSGEELERMKGRGAEVAPRQG